MYRHYILCSVALDDKCRELCHWLNSPGGVFRLSMKNVLLCHVKANFCVYTKVFVFGMQKTGTLFDSAGLNFTVERLLRSISFLT